MAPGNGGTQTGDQLENIALTQPEELADFVQREGVSLTVVGPEAPWLPAWWTYSVRAA
ncbi:phosphoribosylglycinamide synthetase, N domain protein [Bordetella holmesii ATCC 51541]|nr:phosphoribosylglycinamide synthetase, N domain protein [Bordetella holmesii ATCC 51541]EWM49412.1 phosphoribosylglycinamide synthetase, N domain protein [Bordetella holmesii 35009]